MCPDRATRKKITHSQLNSDIHKLVVLGLNERAEAEESRRGAALYNHLSLSPWVAVNSIEAIRCVTNTVGGHESGVDKSKLAHCK